MYSIISEVKYYLNTFPCRNKQSCVKQFIVPFDTNFGVHFVLCFLPYYITMIFRLKLQIAGVNEGKFVVGT